jgi:hypothetical protein
MGNLGTFEALLAEVGKALLPLKEAVSSPANFVFLMQKLGWQADAIPQPLQDLGAGVDALFSELRKVVGDGLSFDGSVGLRSDSASVDISLADILALKHALEQIINGIHGLAMAPDAAFPPSLIADDFKNKFPKQVIDYLVVQYLTTYQHTWGFGFRALGIIKKKYIPSAGNRMPYVEYSLDLSDLPKLLENPRVLLENAFGWGSDEFDYSAFVSQVENLVWTLGADVFVEEMPKLSASSVEGNVDIEGDPGRKVMKAVFFERARNTGRMSAEIRLLYLPKNAGKKPGFALMPAFNGMLDFTMQLSPDVAVTIKSDADLQGGVALLIRPDSAIETVLGFNGGPITHASASLGIEVERSNPNNTPILILGSADATRLQYKKIGGAGGISLDSSNATDVFAEVDLKGLEFVFEPSDGDGFIQKIFPSGGVGLGFDLAAGISYQRGFYFRGTSHLEIEIPAHIQIGPIDLQSLTIAANPKDGKVPINLGATVKAALGPLSAVVENIGLTATFSFPDRGGNLGVLDLSLGFKPPNGVGLAVDAGVVKGGGYLFFDFDKEEYAGALELMFSGIVSLKAIGLLTTKMPDGSKGFSLLIIITAEFGTGIQLGFGFTLLGVGGLLGLNRTVRLEQLAAGVRTGAVNNIMFPQDVVANAPRIISDLRTIFPPEQGKFLIGPMAKLGWGTPTLISLSLGIIIEIPGNLAILGVLRCILPTEDAAILVLQVAFVGAIEFDKKRLWLFAGLFESRVLFITLEGEMGVLAAFGDDANYVISVGGFHPRFTPPPLPFPVPNRLALDLLNEPGERIRVEGYFAVTTNTVQFGAHAELVFGFDDFGLHGHLGFDALFQFSPFYFIIQVGADLSLDAFGLGLFSVDLDFALEGPTPYRAHGRGSISLFFFDISADFDITWGETRDTTLPPIDIMPALAAQFDKLENWKAFLPANTNLLVSLRHLDAVADGLVLHPLGTLRVTQRYVPLDSNIDKVGTQKPHDAKHFTLQITSADLVKTIDVPELFAPAQFHDMSNADKLSKPAYAPEHGGLELSASGPQLNSSQVVKRIARYEQIIIDTNFKRFAKKFRNYSGVLFDHFLKGNAISKSTLSVKYKQQMQPFKETIKAGMDNFAVAFTDNNKAYKDEAVFTSVFAAQDYLAQAITTDPGLTDSLHVIPHAEVNRTAA